MVTAGANFDRATHLAAPRSRVAHRTTATAGGLAEELQKLKRERNVVILAHNYQVPELQDVADFVGDSLGLSYQAAKTDADVILFCGVHFMAETAKIINPTKRVILPDLDAGCSLSESCPPEKLAEFLKKQAEKNYYVIAYINCSAGVKAQADVICTSGNADKIVRAAPEDRNIVFVPDQNLGAWVMERTGRKMDLWQGTCYVHVTGPLPQIHFATGPLHYPRTQVLIGDEHNISIFRGRAHDLVGVAAGANHVGLRFHAGAAIDISDDVVVLLGLLFQKLGHEMDAAEKNHVRIGFRGLITQA